MIKNIKIPYVLLFLYVVLFTALAVNPYDRTVWIAENIPIMIIVLILVFTHKKIQFSDTSYVLMSFLIYLHTVGGHYSFARVPFDFVTNLFGFERNNFDRLAHFTVGFYAYAIAELLHKKKLVNSKMVLFLFPLFFIMSLAAGYELFEWQYAVLGNPEAGVEVLGSQGDIWDAQRDILSDTLGAIFALGLFWIFYRKELNSLYL